MKPQLSAVLAGGLALAIAQRAAHAASDTALHLTNASGASNAYVEVADHADFRLQQFTLEAWIDRTGAGYGFSTDPSGAAIIAKPIQGTSGSNIASWHLHWTPNGEIHFNLTHTPHTSGVYLLSSAVANPDARHHVAVTFDGATIKEYIDGALVGQAPWSLGTVYYGTDAVLLGADNFDFGYSRRFDGWLDDVRVWSLARTATQINADKDCRLTGSEQGLVAYWTFDGSDLSDQTGHNHGGVAQQVGGALGYGPLVSIPTCTSSVPVGEPANGLRFAIHPQPARERVTLSFELPSAGPVTIDVLDLAGRRLSRQSAEYSAGRHDLTLERRDLGPAGRGGMLFVRLRSGATVVTRPAVLLE